MFKLFVLLLLVSCTTVHNNYMIVVDNQEVVEKVKIDIDTLYTLQSIKLLEEMTKPEPVCPMLRELGWDMPKQRREVQQY